MRNIYENGIESLSIQITQNCNMRCSYCYYSSKVNNSINKKIVDKCVRGVFLSKGMYKNFIITGGEPFLDFEKFCYVVNRIIKEGKKSNKKYRIVCPTNGAVMTKEIADFIEKNNIIVSFSIDGEPKEHNRFRKTVNGKGSLSKIMKSISYLDKEYFNKNCFVSMTIHPKMVDKLVKNYAYIYKNIHKNIEIFPCRFVKWSKADKTRYNKYVSLINLKLNKKNQTVENKGLYVDVFGNIFPCSLFTNKKLDKYEMKIGQIKPEKIVIKTEFKNKKIKSCAEICHNICKKFY